MCVLAQDRPVEMPPDLLHVRRPGCHITSSTSGVFNAKTKEIENRVLWQVTPYANYEPLPIGGNRYVCNASSFSRCRGQTKRAARGMLETALAQAVGAGERVRLVAE